MNPNPHPKPQPDGTIVCPECLRVHGLYYWRETNGKRLLCYTCDRHQVHNVNGTMLDKHGGQAIQMKIGTHRVTLDEFVDDLPIPEEWSRGWKKQQQAKQELQLTLMTPRRNK